MKNYDMKKLLLISFFVLISFSTLSSGADAYTVRPGHPRIYITPDNIDAIRARCAGTPGPEDGIQDDYYTNLKEWGDQLGGSSIYQSAFRYAFLVQMGEIPGHTYDVKYNGKTGIDAYAEKGIEILTTQTITFESITRTLLPTLMAYDWLYDYMTPAERKIVVDQLIAKYDARNPVLTNPIGIQTPNERFHHIIGVAFYGDGAYIGDGSQADYYNNKAIGYCDDFETYWKDWILEGRLIAFRGGGYTYGAYGTSAAGLNGKLWITYAWYTATNDKDIKIYNELKNLPLFYMHNLIPYKVPTGIYSKYRRETGDGVVRFGDDGGCAYDAANTNGFFEPPGGIFWRWTAGLAMAEDLNDPYLNNLMWFIRYHITDIGNNDLLSCPTCPGHPYDISEDSYGLVFDIITRNEDIAPIQPTELAHFFGTTNTGPTDPEQGWNDGTPEGVGIVTMRTAWEDPDATLVWFKATSYKTTHYHEDEGSFQIYKKGWLAIDSGQYDDNAWDSQYGRRTIAHNAMTIYRPGEYTWGPDIGFAGGPNDAGQRVPHRGGSLQNLVPDTHMHLGGIRKFESIPNEYDYTHADITRAYNSIYHVDDTDQGNVAKVSLVQRDLVFLRPDYVVIYDRVDSTDSEYPKRWLLHSVYRPQLNGAESFSGTIPYSTNIPDKPGGVPLQGDINAGISESYDTDIIQIEGWKSNEDDFTQPAPGPSEGRLFTKTLLPKQHITRLVGGPGYEFMDAEYNNYVLPGKHGSQHEFMGSWRIEVEPSGSDYPKNYNTFLHVLYPTDNSVSQMPTTQLIESSSGQEMQGAFVEGNSPNKVVMFARNNEEISSTTFTIPGSGETDILIVDLEPNANYYYKVSGQTVELSQTDNGGALQTSSDQGTLYFTALLSSFDYVICQCTDGTCDCPVDAIPAPGQPAKGETIIDPTFHTTITRITDADNDLGSADMYMRINYPKHDIANSDGSMLLLRGNSGGGWHLYDGDTFDYIKALNPSYIDTGHGDPDQRWDDADPNVFYHRRYATLYKYTVDRTGTDTNEVVHDFTNEYPTATIITMYEEGSPSIDTRYWTFAIGEGFSLLAIVVYDKELDTIVGTLTGVSAPDWISMSPSGNKVVIRFLGGTVKSYNRDFTGELTVATGAGHADLGLGANGNDVIVYFGDSGGNSWLNVADVETGVETPLINWNPLYGSSGCHNSGGHISGIDNPSMGGWAIVSTYGAYLDAACWPDQSIYLVELKETPRVWRIDHHHSYYNEYGDYPAATINRAGTKIFFNSNWDSAVYLDDLDVYQVELPPAWHTDLGGTTPQCSGACKPNSCSSYEDCTPLSGTCASGYCCQGLCTPDTTPPSITSGPAATSIATSSATISWTTDEQSDSLLRYGTSPGTYTNSDSNPSYVTSHSIQLTGLTADTTYYYAVESADSAGNPVQSGEYTFTTSPVPAGTVTETWGETPDSDHPGTAEDTFIDSGTAGSNYAADTHIKTYTWPANTIANAIIMKWDLIGIPDTATVTNATLYLYMDSMLGSGGDSLYDISAHKITNANPTISTCTWNSPWTSPGAQSDISSAEDTKSIDKTYGYKPWSVTGMVQDWVSDPSANYGVLVNSDPVAGSNSNRFFASSEHSDATRRPKLVITYSIYHPADLNQDSCIQMSELVAYIDLWKLSSTAVPMPSLMDAIKRWKQGMGC